MNQLKNNTSTIFNLVLINKTISLRFFFFFLIIDLYFLVAAVIEQIYIPTAELLIPSEISTKKAKAEIETHLVTVEAKISKCLI